MSTREVTQASRRKHGKRPAAKRLFVFPYSPGERADEFARQEMSPSRGLGLDLWWSEYSPVVVRVFDQDNRLHLMLQIDDRTTVQQLYEAARLVVPLQKRLLERQGPWMDDTETWFFEELCRAREEKKSWAKLAAGINRLVGMYLVNWFECIEGLRKALESDTPESLASWDAKQSSHIVSHMRAQNVLKLMKLADSEIEEICREALKNIANDRRPFYPHENDEYPFDKYEVRSTVESYLDSDLHLSRERCLKRPQSSRP